MPRRLGPVAVALVVLATFALPAGAPANEQSASDLSCNGVYTGGTYANVTVPSGGSCTLTDVKVLGTTTVLSGANLNLMSSGSIGGSLAVGSQATVYEDTGWVVSGPTAANGAADVTLDGTVHAVLAQKTTGLYLQFATVNGDLVSNQSNGFGSIYGSTIKGDVVVNASTGDPYLGGAWNINGPGQRISGSVIVTNNQVPVDVDTNQIRQNLICTGNNPPPVNFANQVGGRSLGQCATVNTGA
jgi:hypothetical protein